MRLKFLDLLFPPYCVGCGKIGKIICNQCRSTVQSIPQNRLVCPGCERLSLDGLVHAGCTKRCQLDGLISFFYYKG